MSTLKANTVKPITTAVDLLLQTNDTTRVTLSAGDGGDTGTVTAAGLVLAANQNLQFGDGTLQVTSGKVLQMVYSSDADQQATSAEIPDDGTLPQSTEGAEYAELATTITPKKATSKLRIDVSLNHIFNTGGDKWRGALFRDSEVGAFSSVVNDSVDNQRSHMTWFAIIDSTATTATTIKLRFGESSGDTAYINSEESNNTNVSMHSVMTVTEIDIDS